MPHMIELSVDRIRVYKLWMGAPVGTILQLQYGSRPVPIVGLRCDVKEANLDALLVLEGPSIGQLLSANDLGQGAAVDVSDCLDIVVKDAAPSVIGQPLQPGKAYCLKGSSGKPVATVLMGAEIPKSNGVKCFIHLETAGRGQHHPDSSPTILLGDVALKPME